MIIHIFQQTIGFSEINQDFLIDKFETSNCVDTTPILLVL